MPSLDSAMEVCWSVVLDYSTVKEVSVLAECSQESREWSRREIAKRAERWKTEASKVWLWCDTALPPRDKIYSSADDLPDTNQFLDLLDGDFWQKNHESASSVFDTVAGWCGGWAQLLHARETQARAPPKLLRNGKRVEFVALGEENAPLAVLFDIHCDGKSKWCGLYPLNKDDLTVDDDLPTLLRLYSTKTLGDATDVATIHSENHEDRSAKYLFSTDANDKRTWRFNVSLVSPKCSETLIASHDIVLNDIRERITSEEGWEMDSGYHVVSRWRNANAMYIQRAVDSGNFEGAAFWQNKNKVLDLIIPDEKLWRSCYGPADVCRPGPKAEVVGLGTDGHTKVIEEVTYNFCYWWDRRDPERERLHVTMDFECNDCLWGDMIVNPPY